MTQGPIIRRLVFFAVPLLLGSLLQQTYNAFDAVVVGNFVSTDALAAVGSSGPLINVIVSFFMGMSSGASVLISRFYGARNAKELKNTVHTSIALAVILGIALSFVGLVLSPALLRMIKTPEEILPEAVTYLRIFFAGLTSATVYNMGAAILTAVGDSKRPLYFLALSATLNVLLNLFFVLVTGMGVGGVALATVIAQTVCAVSVVILLNRQVSDIRLDFKQIKIHKHILKDIIKIGLPGGIQGIIVSSSNFIVQSYINKLGAAVVAGYSAASRIDGFIMMPIQAMMLAISTFVGQNLGARKVKRARDGVRVSMFAGFCCTITVSLFVFTFGKYILRVFTPDEHVLSYGTEFIRIFVPGYFLLCFTQILPGGLRGAGDVKIPTLAAIGSFVVLRQIYLYFVTKISHTTFTVALAYPATWFVAAIIISIYYLRSDWSKFEGELTPP